MTAITKTEYISKINGMRTAPAGKSPVVNSTDIGYASSGGVTLNTPSTTPANAAVGDLPTDNVIGTDIRDLMVPKAQAWSRVRIVKYVLSGNIAPAGSSYTRYAYITSPVQPTRVPVSSNAIYNILDAEEEVDLSDFNSLINSLKSYIAQDNAELEYTFSYCHSNCHSSCHASRGRR